MPRPFRLILLACCAALAAIFAGLWISSYFHSLDLLRHTQSSPTDSLSLRLGSSHGSLSFGWTTTTAKPSQRPTSDVITITGFTASSDSAQVQLPFSMIFFTSPNPVSPLTRNPGDTGFSFLDSGYHGFTLDIDSFPSDYTLHSRTFAISLALPTLLCALPPLLALYRRRKHHIPHACPRCQYDLRATPERCPECGHIPQPAPTPTSAPAQ